jgi:hypothetical protein
VKNAHDSLLQMAEKSSEKLPANKGANRQLDCAVIKYVHEINKRLGLPMYDTIRSAFLEGVPIYPDSNFTDRLHIEICVLNPDLIKGYFLPRPIDEFNPYLTKEFTNR